MRINRRLFFTLFVNINKHRKKVNIKRIQYLKNVLTYQCNGYIISIYPLEQNAESVKERELVL